MGHYLDIMRVIRYNIIADIQLLSTFFNNRKAVCLPWEFCRDSEIL